MPQTEIVEVNDDATKTPPLMSQMPVQREVKARVGHDVADSESPSTATPTIGADQVYKSDDETSLVQQEHFSVTQEWFHMNKDGTQTRSHSFFPAISNSLCQLGITPVVLNADKVVEGALIWIWEELWVVHQLFPGHFQAFPIVTNNGWVSVISIKVIAFHLSGHVPQLWTSSFAVGVQTLVVRRAID